MGRGHRRAVHRNDWQQTKSHLRIQGARKAGNRDGEIRARPCAGRPRDWRAVARGNCRERDGRIDRRAAKRRARRAAQSGPPRRTARAEARIADARDNRPFGSSQNALRTSRRVSMIAVVILSAGESRRMGQPKALLSFPETFSFESAREIRSRSAAQAAGEALPSSGQASLAPTKTKSKPNAGRFGFAQRKSEAAEDTKPKTFLEHLIDVTRHPRVGALRAVVCAHAAVIRARVTLPNGAIIVNEN